MGTRSLPPSPRRARLFLTQSPLLNDIKHRNVPGHLLRLGISSADRRSNFTALSLVLRPEFGSMHQDDSVDEVSFVFGQPIFMFTGYTATPTARPRLGWI